VGIEPSRTLFPASIHIASNKGASIADNMERSRWLASNGTSNSPGHGP
jgi:hypothetical protein